MSSQGSLRLRRARADDLDRIIEFLRPFFYESFWSKFTGSEEKARQRIEHYVLYGESIILEDSEILGFSALLFDHHFCEELFCDIALFYVHPLARRTGVSRMLLEASVSFAKLRNAAIITASGNSGIEHKLWRNLFARQGFRDLGSSVIMEL